MVGPRRRSRRRWGVTVLLVLITAVVLVPVAVVPWELFGPVVRQEVPLADVLRSCARDLASPSLQRWLVNSLVVTLTTVVVALLVATPAGYVVARGRSRTVSGYALALFLLQCLPVVFLVVPLFILLARVGTVGLPGLTVVCIAVAVPAATWMVSTSMVEVPITLEHAAWLDGCSPVQAFRRVVLPASRPALLTATTYTFLLTWSEYTAASVFLREDSQLTLGLALLGRGGGAVTALVMVVPPLLALGLGHRYTAVGGVAGALVE